MTEEELWQKYKAGELTKGPILEFYLPFLTRQARTLSNENAIKFPECLSICIEAAEKCIDRFDSSKGSFVNICWSRCEGAVLDHFREIVRESERKLSHQNIKFEEPTQLDSEINTFKLDLPKYVKCLTAREKDILFRNLVEGETLREISKSYKLTRSALSHIKKISLKKLRKYIEKLDGYKDNKV